MKRIILDLSTLLISLSLVMSVIVVHYELLRLTTAMVPKFPGKLRFRIVFVIMGAIMAHIVEIFIFALGMYVLSLFEVFGSITGRVNHAYGVLEYIYFSASTYTSLGFGDIVPEGRLRLITATETISGLVLITWTASFAFYHMERLWKDKL